MASYVIDDLVRISCVLMRGGTSKGPFFLATDLPSEPGPHDAVLLSAMGSGHELAVQLAALDAAGSETGQLLPTGSPVEVIDGVQVSCVDAAMPVVIIRADALGKTGHEPAIELGRDPELKRRLERLRIEAGRRMGITDAAEHVIPKPVLVAPAADGGTLAVRYFTPHSCHGALAMTGAISVAMAAVTPGTVAAALAGELRPPAVLHLEHPAGKLSIRLEQSAGCGEPVAFVVRTARRLFEGSVMVKPAAPKGREG